MKKRTVLTAAMGAVMAVAGTLALSPSAAQAAWACQSGWVCIYHDYDLSGSAAVLPELNPLSGAYTGQVADFRNYKYTNGTNLNDSASSVSNGTSKAIYLYPNVNYKGTPLVCPPQSWCDLASENDSFSSAKMLDH